ncbi:methionine ABC transporter ATP-binding protein [Enterococcus sp. RIT-PI-f]|uniref:methionine ABC transporter ATP-binding protein n=1 Tax=Enterococcus sp. RIT-PI-f TaxID=1690244 RepID=UPI0006B9B341|nr:methionine ABC transporter ATP-binding protein [Enterococcus sp. RIT-PI-f]KPG71317.1 methionine ABC transporter ATP-binding protein [Enterococcus sp. RIT-PI-f]
MAKIEVKQVSVLFKQNKQFKKAVDSVDFSVQAGEVFGIVGLSGAGKSTLVRTLNLLQVPSSGQILIDGQDITKARGQELRQIRQKIGMIFQHFNLIHNRTIKDNLAFALKAGNYPKDQREARIMELLEMVDLTDKLHAYPNNLSGGEKQRIGIARAIANQPEILLCDEATSALDVETTEETLQLLTKIKEQTGITIVFITHELDVARKFFDRVAVMENGRIVEEQTTYGLFSQPNQPITQKLVGRYLDLTLPEEILALFTQGDLLELRYQGEYTLEPLISTVAKAYDVAVNIIHGKIDYIQQDVIGILYVYLTGPQEEIDKARAYIAANVFSLRKVGAAND